MTIVQRKVAELLRRAGWPVMIALRVRRARLLAREPHAAQHPGHARRVISLAEMSGHPAAQIAARPGATTVAVGLGTAQDHRCQCRFLPLSQPSLRSTL